MVRQIDRSQFDGCGHRRRIYKRGVRIGFKDSKILSKPELQFDADCDDCGEALAGENWNGGLDVSILSFYRLSDSTFTVDVAGSRAANLGQVQSLGP